MSRSLLDAIDLFLPLLIAAAACVVLLVVFL